MNKNLKRKAILVIGGLFLLYIPLSCYDRSTEPTVEENTDIVNVSAKSSEIEIVVTDKNNIQVNGEKTTLDELASVIETILIGNENQIKKIVVKPSEDVSLDAYGSIIEELQRRTFRSDIISANIETFGFQAPTQGVDSASQQADSDQPVFVPYDEAPEPIGGYAAILKKVIYPEEAKANYVEGRVMIQAQIDENGDVVRTVVMKPLESLCDEAAAAAIQSVKWKPAYQGDEPVKVWIAVPVDFKLQQDDSSSADESPAPPPPPPPNSSPTDESSAPPPPPPLPPSQQINEEAPVFVPYEEPPQPIGGYEEIQNKLIYPESAKDTGIEGRVMIQARVDENGTVTRTVVMRSLESSCDEAAMEAIKSVKWKPAKYQGAPITVWVAVPVDFVLK